MDRCDPDRQSVYLQHTEHVIRWGLILEEFNPTLTYIKGENNIVVDALSRLDIADKPLSQLQAAEAFSLEKDDLPSDAYPLSYRTIMIHQQAYRKLQELALKDDNYSLTKFHGGGKTRTLITKNSKIVVPGTLQQCCVQWYHLSLCHPGVTRMEQTIRQHFTWKTVRRI